MTRPVRRRGFRLDGAFFWSSALPTLVALALLAWLASGINWSFVQALDFASIYKFRFALLQGLANTLIITVVGFGIGLVVGVILAALQYAPFAPVRWAIGAYIEILRNTPIVVQLFWIHFALPELSGISTTTFQSGCIAMMLQSSAYLADLARGGIMAVPRGQWDAADSVGLPVISKWMTIILPQAIRIIIPPLANMAIGMFKLSATLALLSVGEFMTVASRVSTFSFRPIETLTIVGIVYLAFGYVFNLASTRLEKKIEFPRA